MKDVLALLLSSRMFSWLRVSEGRAALIKDALMAASQGRTCCSNQGCSHGCESVKDVLALLLSSRMFSWLRVSEGRAALIKDALMAASQGRTCCSNQGRAGTAALIKHALFAAGTGCCMRAVLHTASNSRRGGTELL